MFWTQETHGVLKNSPCPWQDLHHIRVIAKISSHAVTIKATLWIKTCVKWFSLDCHRKLKHSKTQGLSYQTRPKLSNSINANPRNFTIPLKSNNLLFLVNILMHNPTPDSFKFAWCQMMLHYTKYYFHNNNKYQLRSIHFWHKVFSLHIITNKSLKQDKGKQLNDFQMLQLKKMKINYYLFKV